jgi:primosomal protein N' (replication factor Y)
MPNQTYLRLALPTPLRRYFDYLAPQGVDCKALKPGVRVKVPFGSRTLVGILIEVVNKTDILAAKLKTAIAILDEEPILTTDVYKLCEWAAQYYHDAFGEVLTAALPVLLRKGALLPSDDSAAVPNKSVLAPLLPNASQQSAIDTIIQAKQSFKTFLLDGITGSGKTEVYLQTIAHYLEEPTAQVLVLVPEISLTPQTIRRFQERFAVPIVALHSSLSDKERLRGWCAARSGEARIVIGTRSAIFTPFKHLTLMIMDEEHDQSFKQQDHFRYHARDLMVMRGSMNNIPVVLGSATPSLESLLNVKRERYQSLFLNVRAGDALLPTYQTIDIREHPLEEGLSQPLLAAMREHLNAGNQVMLFLNRRGFAPVLYCTECAHIVGCERCDTRMVYHRKPPRLHCHYCDAKKPVPKRCVKCNGESLAPVGLGTQRIEEVLQQYFPDVPVIRVDRDSTRKKNALHALLEEINNQPKAILLGTQMLAKGHHFPNVTLVGMIDADHGFFSVDFRALEQMGQLLVQVSGRAGRAEKPGTVLIQTAHPDHPLLQTLLKKNYAAFAQQLLNEREQALLPPYTYFAVFRAESYNAEASYQFLNQLKLAITPLDTASILGPVPALVAKRKGLHCQQLLVKATKRSTLQGYLKSILSTIDTMPRVSGIKWLLDVDPVEMG